MFASFVCIFSGFSVREFPENPKEKLGHFLLTEGCMQ